MTAAPTPVGRRRPRAAPAVSALLAASAALAVLAVGCSREERADRPGLAGGEQSASITVSAAASLTEAFTTIKDDFVAAHPGAEVALNFGSSGQLATQIVEGAPADVAAFADEVPMDELVEADLIDGDPVIFARNQLVIVTEPGNPEGIASLEDLASAGTVSLCVDTAPCGKFADQLLADAGVSVPAASITRGQDVKATLAAVTEGDAVAAVVYVTDARAAGDRVATVEIPEADNLVANYPIAVVAGGEHTEVARAFMEEVLGPDGQKVLADAGFLAP